ncbi:MAG: septum formation initiator family protein [Firmicutes bacterium]|nr:septum formation initiator family protein [Bacillota bacterium]
MLAAVVISAFLLLSQIHLSQLSQENSRISAAQRESDYIHSQNVALRSEIKSLEQMSFVERIARVQYGLVSAGQTEYEIASGSSGSGGTAVVRPNISKSSLEEGDAAALTGSPLLPVGKATGHPSGGIVHRMLGELEFWSWSF